MAKAGTNVLHLSEVVRTRHSSSVSRCGRESRVKTFWRRDDPVGGGSLGSVPPVNVDREKLLLFVYTGGMRDARLTRRARLVYAGSRITTLIKRSGGVDAAAGSFGGAVIPQSIYDLRPLTPATRRRNESC